MFQPFSTWIPLASLSKAGEEAIFARDGSGELGKIGGIMSTEDRDHQGEIVRQSGMDWSYFLKSGWFNYEHANGPENVLGYPTKVTRSKVDGKPVTRVEGVLYLGIPKAKAIFERARVMAQVGDRKLGFSVEGQVLERDKDDPKIVTKSRVINCAITAHPVNAHSELEAMAKSLLAGRSLREDAELFAREQDVQADLFEKAGVGYQSPATGGGGLAPLVPQSIEGGRLSSATFEVDEEFMREARKRFRRVFPEARPEVAERVLRGLLRRVR